MHEGDAFHELIEHARTGKAIGTPKSVLKGMLAIQAERNFLRTLVVQEHAKFRALQNRPHHAALSDAEVFLDSSTIDFRRDFDVNAFCPAFKDIPGE
jgi:hypothetical protein